ncbi:MAG: phosphatidate cytidylyltransferase [Oscillospiraceae bacterium]|jgi:phosphatidate cytidylyltransferase|nr:phosphatidate cytidylyltransferase [Oscillospiraceae bacterium]
MATRVIAAAVGLPILLATVLLLPPLATAIVFAAACAVAAYEMLWRTGFLKHRRIVLYTAVMAAAVVLWSWMLACAVITPKFLWLSALLGLFVFFTALFCELLSAHKELKFSSLCIAVFSGIVYPMMIGALVRLRGMDGGQYFILVAFLLSMVADSGAYFVGRAFGRHKLAPIISPKKTVEGVIGGVAANVAMMLLFTLLLSKAFGFAQVHYLYAVVYGVLGAGASTVGDLTLSVAKRQTGIKDYGNLIPGHGGILDRFDSTMLVAPLTEILILLIPFAVK